MASLSIIGLPLHSFLTSWRFLDKTHSVQLSVVGRTPEHTVIHLDEYERIWPGRQRMIWDLLASRHITQIPVVEKLAARQQPRPYFIVHNADTNKLMLHDPSEGTYQLLAYPGTEGRPPFTSWNNLLLSVNEHSVLDEYHADMLLHYGTKRIPEPRPRLQPMAVQDTHPYGVNHALAIDTQPVAHPLAIVLQNTFGMWPMLSQQLRDKLAEVRIHFQGSLVPINWDPAYGVNILIGDCPVTISPYPSNDPLQIYAGNLEVYRDSLALLYAVQSQHQFPRQPYIPTYVSPPRKKKREAVPADTSELSKHLVRAHLCALIDHLLDPKMAYDGHARGDSQLPTLFGLEQRCVVRQPGISHRDIFPDVEYNWQQLRIAGKPFSFATFSDRTDYLLHGYTINLYSLNVFDLAWYDLWQHIDWLGKMYPTLTNSSFYKTLTADRVNPFVHLIIELTEGRHKGLHDLSLRDTLTEYSIAIIVSKPPFTQGSFISTP